MRHLLQRLHATRGRSVAGYHGGGRRCRCTLAGSKGLGYLLRWLVGSRPLVQQVSDHGVGSVGLRPGRSVTGRDVSNMLDIPYRQRG